MEGSSNMNQNINPQNLDALLRIVSAKINVPPDVLKSQLEKGQFDAALNNMNKEESNKFRQVMSNPKLAEKIMTTPQAQELYKRLTGGR
jgi:5'(3')-deoxyribonucleotidase